MQQPCIQNRTNTASEMEIAPQQPETELNESTSLKTPEGSGTCSYSVSFTGTDHNPSMKKEPPTSKIICLGLVLGVIELILIVRLALMVAKYVFFIDAECHPLNIAIGSSTNGSNGSIVSSNTTGTPHIPPPSRDPRSTD